MKPRWKLRLPQRASYTTEVSKDGHILCLVDHQSLWCVLPNGEVAWRRPIADAGRLFVVDRSVIVVGRTLARIDIESGRVLAARDSGSDCFEPRFDDGVLTIGEHHRIWEIDLETLEPAWQWPSGDYVWDQERLWMSGLDGLVKWVDPRTREQGRIQLHRPPVGAHVSFVIDGVFCRLSGPELLGVDIVTGEILWRHFDLSRLSEIGISDVDHTRIPHLKQSYLGQSGNLFFIGGSGSGFTAVDARSGRPVWQVHDLFPSFCRPPHDEERVLLLGRENDTEPKAVVLRRSDGHRLAEVSLADRYSEINVAALVRSRGVVLEEVGRNCSILEMFDLQDVDNGIAGNENLFSLPAFEPELRRRIEANWPPRAAEVLAQLKAADPASFARRALTHPDAQVRLCAAEMFGETRDESSVGPLAAVLEDEDFLMRTFAASALVNIGTDAAVDSVIAAFQKDVAKQGYNTSRWFASALAHAGRRGSEALVMAMKQGTGDLDFVGDAVLEDNHPDLVPGLVGLFKKKKRTGSWSEYDALLRLGAASIQPVIDALPELADFGKARGLDLLGYFRVKAAVPAVLAETQSTDVAVRVAAVRALGAIADKAALPVLTTLATDVDPDVRRTAVDALRQVDLDAALDVLIARLSDEDAAVRGAAADAFADRVDARAIPPLLAMISTTGPHAPAAVALARVGQEVVPELVTLLGSRDFCAKYWAITALGWIADPRARSPLAKQAKSTKEVIAGAAALALERLP